MRHLKHKGVISLAYVLGNLAFGTALQNVSSCIGDSQSDFVGKKCIFAISKRNPNLPSQINYNSLKEGIHYDFAYQL